MTCTSFNFFVRSWIGAATVCLLFGLPFLNAEPVSDVTPSDTPLPEKIVAQSPRNETDDDQVVAAANFVQARIAQQRGETGTALSKYERSWRYDPQNMNVLAEIVALATQSERFAEAKRYAIAAAHLKPEDPLLVRRLAILLAKEDQYAESAELFERALQLSGDKDEPPGDLSRAFLLLELGRLHVKAGNVPRGAEVFLRLRQSLIEPHKTGLGPENVAIVLDEADHTWLLLGETFLQANRLDDAADAFRRANDSQPQPAQLNYNLARVALARNDIDQALDHLQSTFSEKYESLGVDPFKLLETLLAKKEANPTAAQQVLLDRLKPLYEANPLYGPLALFYAQKLRDDPAKLKEAQAVYEQLIEKRSSAEAYEGLAAVFIAQQDSAALAKLLGTVADKTGSLLAISNTQDALLTQEQQPLLEKMLVTQAEQVEKEPDEANAGQSLALGLLALESKQPARGKLLLEHAVDHSEQKTQALLRWGMALLASNDAAGAAEVLQRAVDLKEETRTPGIASYYQAGALELAGRTAEALAAIAAAEKANSNSPMFVHRRAWILYHSNQLADAEAAYKELLAACDKLSRSSDIRDLAIEAKLILSNLAHKRGNYSLAVEWLEQVLDEDPANAPALNDLSYLWSDAQQHLARSLAMAQQAVEQQPDNSAYRDTLGWAYFQLGQFPAALKEIEQAVRERPEGVILEHLGDTLDKLGRRDEAQAAWKKAADAFAEEKDESSLQAVKKKLDLAAAAQ